MTATTHHARRPSRERRPLAAVPASTPPDAAAVRSDIARAVTATAAARAQAERALRVSELVRSRAAHALEQDLRPMRIDETTRAMLRDEYAAADVEVARHREALARATRLDLAAREIATAVADAEAANASDAANGVGAVLIAWSRLRDAVGGPRFAPA